jgi:phosphatidylglycerol---prolipoprotein diacylglyceryl transferase
MLPILFKLDFHSPGSQLALYAVALLLVAYTAWSGWRGAAEKSDRLRRAGMFGAIGALLAGAGLHYALPASAFLGGKGQGIAVHAYGILLIGGFVAAVAVCATLAQREWRGEEGLLKRDQVLDLAVWVLIAGLAGSRLLFMAVNWETYAAAPSKLLSLEGGLVFYGGLLAAMGASFVFTRTRRIDFFRLGDVGIPTVSLGQAFGRLGCFTSGCCWGDVAAEGSSVGVHFPAAGHAVNLFGQPTQVPSNAALSQLADGRWVLPSTGEVFAHPVAGAVRISDWVAQHGHTLPVHPTQLYEAIGQLLIFTGCLALRRFRRFHGQILGVWLIAAALLRSGVELFRGDVERGTLHGLLTSLGLEGAASAIPLEAWFNVSTSQFISLCLFGLGVGILWRRSRAPAVATPPTLIPAPIAEKLVGS